MSSFVFTLMFLLAAPPQDPAPATCESLEAEGRVIQAELEELQRQNAAETSPGRHSGRAVAAGLVLNVLGAVTPVRGADAAASAGAMGLGLAGRAADRAEAETSQAELDRRMEAALDHMDALAARAESLCGDAESP